MSVCFRHIQDDAFGDHYGVYYTPPVLCVINYCGDALTLWPR